MGIGSSNKKKRRLEEYKICFKNDIIENYINNLSNIDIETKIKEITEFNLYGPLNIKLKKKPKKIKGIYFQYDKGCILYALINGGWINEKYIPDSMKFYKCHSYQDDPRDDKHYLRKMISLIDLAQLWMNLGGKSPYLEIDVIEAKKRIFNVLKYYFDTENIEIKKKEIKNAFHMTLQNIEYYKIIGNINIKYILLKEYKNKELIENPSLKKAIDLNIIKKDDIVLFKDHFFIYDGLIYNNGNKLYSFIDSLTPIYGKKDDKEHENGIINKIEGKFIAYENNIVINMINNEEIKVGKLEIINN